MLNQIHLIILIVFSQNSQIYGQDRQSDNPNNEGYGNNHVNQTNDLLDIQNQTLDVHLIVHSHDDVGWLKTVDEYYLGKGSGWAGPHCVKCILDDAFNSLLKNEQRIFNQVEIYFFKRWYEDLNEENKMLIKNLVKNGQLNFISGGLSMTDEATAYYDDIITMMTAGHQFLKTEFNFSSKIGWQIDPFGHSLGYAFICKLLDFNELFIERIYYQDMRDRIKNANMEFFWQTQSENQIKFDLLTHVNYLKYSNVNEQYLKSKQYQNFANLMLTSSTSYRTNQIFHHVGDDFERFTDDRYKVLEAAIEYFQKNPQYNINLFFSTPQNYSKGVYNFLNKNKDIQLSIKKDDFYPYSDNDETTYWTGYFTTHPELKGEIRQAGRMFKSFQILFTKLFIHFRDNYQSFNSKNEIMGQKCLSSLEQAIGITQHHDSITGTSQFAVIQDYRRIIKESIQQCDTEISTNFQQFFMPEYENDNLKQQFFTTSTLEINENRDQTITVLLFNPLLVKQNDAKIILDSFKFDIEGYFIKCYNEEKLEIKCQTIQLSNNKEDREKNIIQLEVDLSPFQFKIIGIEFEKRQKSFLEEPQVKNYTLIQLEELQGKKIEININEFKSIIINCDFELTTTNISYQFLQNNISQKYDFSIDYTYYVSASQSAQQKSGAYIMRVESDQKISLESITKIYYSIGSISLVLYIERKDKIVTQIIFYKQESQNEIEIYTDFKQESVINGYGGQEFTLNIKNYNMVQEKNNNFFTDSNGLMMVKRTRKIQGKGGNEIPKNYYPITSCIYIENQNQKMSIISDRSQGATSLKEGEIEIMIQRIINTNDQRGMTEGIPKGERVQLRHWLIFNDFDNTFQRNFQIKLNFPILKVITKQHINSSRELFNFSLDKQLNDSENLAKFEFIQKDNQSIIIRVQNLISQGQQNITFDYFQDKLNQLQQRKNRKIMIQEIKEYSLSQTNLKQIFEIKSSNLITLEKYEIKTFLINFEIQEVKSNQFIQDNEILNNEQTLSFNSKRFCKQKLENYSVKFQLNKHFLFIITFMLLFVIIKF